VEGTNRNDNLVNRLQQSTTHEADCEQIQKWWNRPRKKTKKRWKRTCSRYYAWGNKARLARSCWKRVRIRVSCLTTNTSRKHEDLHKNSTWLGIDTFSTYCLTNDQRDIIEGTGSEVSDNVTGTGGKKSSTITYEGAGTFRIIYDTGQTYELPVPELYCCPTVAYRILTPQHLDQCWRSTGLGTVTTTTNGDGTTLMWKDSTGTRQKKAIPLTGKSNIPICYTVPSYGR
jgi:hypothetical protein